MGTVLGILIDIIFKPSNLNSLFAVSFLLCNAVTVLNAAKSLKIQSTMNFKNLKFIRILNASLLAVRPSSTSATALEFLHNKDNRIRFTKLLF